MAESLYSVVLEGVVLDGFDAQETQERLAKLFKIQHDAAGRMLSGNIMTVKKGVDKATAENYLKALEGVGARCHLEEMAFDLVDSQVISDIQYPVDAIHPGTTETKTQSRIEIATTAKEVDTGSVSYSGNGASSDIVKQTKVKPFVIMMGVLIVCSLGGAWWYFDEKNSSSLIAVEEFGKSIQGYWVCGKKSIATVSDVEIIDSKHWRSVTYLEANDDKNAMAFTNKISSWDGRDVLLSNENEGSIGFAGDPLDVASVIMGGRSAKLMNMPGNSVAHYVILGLTKNGLTYKDEVQGQGDVVSYCNRIDGKELYSYIAKGVKPKTADRIDLSRLAQPSNNTKANTVTASTDTANIKPELTIKNLIELKKYVGTYEYNSVIGHKFVQGKLSKLLGNNMEQLNHMLDTKSPIELSDNNLVITGFVPGLGDGCVVAINLTDGHVGVITNTSEKDESVWTFYTDGIDYTQLPAPAKKWVFDTYNNISDAQNKIATQNDIPRKLVIKLQPDNTVGASASGLTEHMPDKAMQFKGLIGTHKVMAIYEKYGYRLDKLMDITGSHNRVYAVLDQTRGETPIEFSENHLIVYTRFNYGTGHMLISINVDTDKLSFLLSEFGATIFATEDEDYGQLPKIARYWMQDLARNGPHSQTFTSIYEAPANLKVFSLKPNIIPVPPMKARINGHLE